MSHDPVTYSESYSGAIKASNLGSRPDTTRSPSDVLGAAGIAGRQAPLALALLRLLSGDANAIRHVAGLMGAMVLGKAHRAKTPMSHVDSIRLAQAVLAWSMSPRCPACGGHGFSTIPGTTTLGGEACGICRGTGRRPFDSEFPRDRLELARWLQAEVEREVAKAAPLAMRALAPRLDIG